MLQINYSQLNLYSLQNHIQDLLTILNDNRERSDVIFNDVFKKTLNRNKYTTYNVQTIKIEPILKVIQFNKITEYL